MRTLRTIGNELHKALLIVWSYRVNLFVEVVIFSTIFGLLSFIMGDSETGRFETRASYYLGFVVFSYTMGGLSGMGFGVREETVSGTFEQMSMSPTPLLILLLGRTGSGFIISTIINLLMAAILVPTLGINLPLRWEGLPVFALMMVGLYALGLVIAGLTVVYKRIEMLANMLANLILLINGSMVAVDKFADEVAMLAKLVPTTQGLIVLRRILFDDASLVTVWNDGSLIFLIVHSLIFAVIGVLIFQWCTRVARQQGTLAHY